MEAQFLDLCRQHDLTSVGTLFQADHDNHLTVYLHWGKGEDARCVSGGAKTFDDALAMALADLSVERGEQQQAVA